MKIRYYRVRHLPSPSVHAAAVPVAGRVTACGQTINLDGRWQLYDTLEIATTTDGITCRNCLRVLAHREGEEAARGK